MLGYSLGCTPKKQAPANALRLRGMKRPEPAALKVILLDTVTDASEVAKVHPDEECLADNVGVGHKAPVP